MNVNKLLEPCRKRIVSDNKIEKITDGKNFAVKGPRKPKGKDYCFTVHRLTSPHDSDFEITNGTIVINYYAPNYNDGNARVELLGKVEERLEELFDDKLLEIQDYNNYNLEVRNFDGPLRDPDEPKEHFISVRLGYNVIKA